MFNRIRQNFRSSRSRSGGQNPNPDPRPGIQALEERATHLCDTSQWDEAERALQELIRAKKFHLGDTDPSILTTKSEMGYTLRQKGDYDAAESIDREVLETRMEMLGESDVEVAKAMDNLALDIKGQGGNRGSEVLELEEKALRIFRAAEGEGSVGTLTAMNNLGNSYRNVGRVEEAVALHEVVVTGKREVLGPRHRETVMSMDTLGLGLRDLEGRVTEGCSVQEEAVRIGREEWGEEDEMVIKCLANLAGTYGRLGDPRGIGMLERVVAAAKRTKGEEHVETVDYMNNLGVAYAREERWEEAEGLLVKVWEWNRRERGENHFKTKGTRQSLGIVMENLGKLVKADVVSTG